MTKKFLLIPVACTLLAACNQDASTMSNASNSDTKNNGMSMDQNDNMSMNQTSADRDNQITEQVNQWLMSNNSLSDAAKNIRVSTSDGMVTLRGSVSDAQEKTRVMNHVKKIKGVKGVTDQLTSMNQDNQITEQVNQWLMSDNSLSANAKNLQASTMDGVVTLSGTVASVQEKNKIMSYVKKMKGVKGITDQITISS